VTSLFRLFGGLLFWLREGESARAACCDAMLDNNDNCGINVMRIADSDFGPVGGEHISIALRELTGLQRLGLGGTCFRDFG
jgi:hypothetical protein